MTKLRCKGHIMLPVLDKICKVLICYYGDIIGYVSDKVDDIHG